LTITEISPATTGWMRSLKRRGECVSDEGMVFSFSLGVGFLAVW
jgi:hypothetical protein